MWLYYVLEGQPERNVLDYIDPQEVRRKLLEVDVYNGGILNWLSWMIVLLEEFVSGFVLKLCH